MGLFSTEMLSQSQLKRLGEHKYSCASASYLDAKMQRFWNWLVAKLPLWLAPNLITVLGLIINIVTSLVLVFYSPDARQDVPRWAYFLCAVGLFVYQSLDAIDGKQARRTNTSSPLGELFDHGCDSISTAFVSLAACIAVKLGSNPSWLFLQCFTAISLFYSAHWQTYVSGTLRFGRFDVTEAQFGVMLVFILSGLFGADMWEAKIPSTNFAVKYLPSAIVFLGQAVSFMLNFRVIFTGGVGKNGSTVAVSSNCIAAFNALAIGTVSWFFPACLIPGLHADMKLLPVGLAVLSATFLCYSNATVIFTGGVGKNGSSVAGTSVLSPCIPFSLVVVPAFIIYQKSITHLYEDHPCLYILAFGLVAAKVTNRLVVAHMTKSEMDYLDSVLVGPGMLFLNQYFNTTVNEYILLWICFIWVTIDLLRYSTTVCNQICRHLDIGLFVIPTGAKSAPITRTTFSKNGTGAKRS